MLLRRSYIRAIKDLFNSLQAEMKCATLLVLLLFITKSCIANPLIKSENIRLWVYDYQGNIDTRSSIDNETLSRWTISGKLSMYNSLEHVVIKFNDVKTSLFNGKRNSLSNAKEKDIPQSAKALLKPFYIKKDENLDIYFESDDQLWSKNLKRGIASNLNIDLNKLNPNVQNQILKEKTIHGYCEVSYNVEETKDKQIYEKTINHENCVYEPVTLTTATGKAPTPESFKPFKAKTVKTATFLPDENGVFLPHHIVSTSNIRIKISPNIPNTQNVDQVQKFNLIDKDVVKEIPFDISKITEKSDLIFEYNLADKYDYAQGRYDHNQTQQSLVYEYLNEYTSFQTKLFSPWLKNVDVSQQQNLAYILYKMNDEGFELLEKEFDKMNYNYNIYAIYYSFLPYLGTESFVKFFAKHINTEKWYLNEYVASNIMSTFPEYLINPTDTTLEQLEVLINLENAFLQSMKNNARLCFAQVVKQVHKNNSTIYKDKIMKYVNIYHEQFLTNENYEDRMTYLLGLINMADVIDIDMINNIITNTSESKNLRLLAITGFKEKLVENSSKLYKTYWSIVENNEEPFEVRVKALDLLLSIKLTDEQFNTIVKKYSGHSNDPEEKQLANYLLSTLHSIQNTTAFFDNLGAQAFEAIQNNHIPSFPKNFATGNYRISHTDDDIGSSLQTQVITDPETNMINFAQITYNNYAFSFNLASYTFYFNFNGLLEALVTQHILQSSRIESIPDLLEVLKNNNYEILPPNTNVNIDIIVFKNNNAIYAVHYGEFKKKFLEIFAEDLEQFFGLQLRLRYPLIDYKFITSDLGTSLQFTHFIEDITYHKSENNLAKLRLIWNYQFWIEVYNPLADTNILSYKYNGEISRVSLNYNKGEKSFSYVNTNNSIAMVWDNIVGTAVEDGSILKEYCENCESYINFDFPYKAVYTKDYEILGIKQKITKEFYSEDNLPINNAFEQFIKNVNYQKNTDATPFAIPYVVLSHYINYKRIIFDDLSCGSYELLPYYEEGTNSSISFSFNGDFKTINDPLKNKNMSLSLHVLHKPIISENSSISWHVDYDMNTENKINEKNKKISFTQKIKAKYEQIGDTEKTKEVCITSEYLFPYLRADKYSLEPLEATLGKVISTFNEDSEDEEDICETLTNFTTLDVIYEPFNKSEILENKLNKKDYEECLSQSKDLKYVEPSSACKRISTQITEYNHYAASGHLTKMENGENITMNIGNPMIEYIREGDYINYGVRKHPSILEFYNISFYYPNTYANPNKISFSDYDYAVPMFATSTCTLTASTVEQFSGKNIPNANEKWLAFAECRSVSRKGLEGFKIGENKIGFVYYSNDARITVDIDDDKVKASLNGENNDIKLYNIDDNALIIVDKFITIFYNTEYIEIKMNSYYPKLLCGLCTNK